MLRYHDGAHTLRELEVSVCHHAAVVFEFSEIAESLDDEDADIIETHRFEIEVLHHET